MKNKGFTLAELLGVIIILGLLIIVAFPPLLNQLKKSQQKLSDATVLVIGTAAEQYVDEHSTTYPIVNNNIYCIPLVTLVNSGYLKSPILDASTGEKIDETKYDVEFKIKALNDYEYALKLNTSESEDKCVASS